MISLGIDQSYTSTGIVIISDDNIEAQTISSSTDDDWFGRAIYVADQVLTIIDNINPDIICMEDLAFGSVGNATRNLAGLQFTIVCAIRRTNRSVILVPPTTLKKFATGKGNSKKTDMYDHLPDEIRTLFTLKKFKKTKGLYDIVDAYWLSKYGLHMPNKC